MSALQHRDPAGDCGGAEQLFLPAMPAGAAGIRRFAVAAASGPCVGRKNAKSAKNWQRRNRNERNGFARSLATCVPSSSGSAERKSQSTAVSGGRLALA